MMKPPINIPNIINAIVLGSPFSLSKAVITANMAPAIKMLIPRLPSNLPTPYCNVTKVTIIIPIDTQPRYFLILSPLFFNKKKRLSHLSSYPCLLYEYFTIKFKILVFYLGTPRSSTLCFDSNIVHNFVTINGVARYPFHTELPI
jgi:hypothetical protein